MLVSWVLFASLLVMNLDHILPESKPIHKISSSSISKEQRTGTPTTDGNVIFIKRAKDRTTKRSVLTIGWPPLAERADSDRDNKSIEIGKSTAQTSNQSNCLNKEICCNQNHPDIPETSQVVCNPFGPVSGSTKQKRTLWGQGKFLS